MAPRPRTTRMFQHLALLALLSAPTARANPEARVEVLGVGTVKLAHAEQSCLAELPQGDVTVATGNHRVPAFQDVASGLLGQESDVRKEYFRYFHNLDWPTAPADVSYVPPLNWMHAGVVGACEAAGAYWVREGIRLSTICPADKTACKAQFTDEEWEVLKEALKLGRKDDNPGKDAFFAYLNANDDKLESWSNPLTYLDRACSWPQVAASQSRFIDRNDLVAARRACLQLQILVTHADALHPIEQQCHTDWRDVASDAAFLVAAPHTDLGMTADYADAQLESLRERLTRMDPSPARCGGDWAAVWRKELVQVWRDAQKRAACEDEALFLADRVHLCPDLTGTTTSACDAGDAAACHRLAAMHLDGIGVPQDEVRATELLLKACGSSHAPSCEQLRGRLPTITAWIDERLAAATPPAPEVPPEDAAAEPAPPVVPEGAHAALDEARGLLDSYGPHLEEGWTRAQVQRLFQAGISARYPDFAAALLTDFGDDVPPEWLASSQAALDALRQELGAPAP